jgi:hypothetical protein
MMNAFFWDVLQEPNSVTSKKTAFFNNCFSDKVLAENFVLIISKDLKLVPLYDARLR